MPRMIRGAEKKRGLSPGTPVYLGDVEPGTVLLEVFSFGPDELQELTEPWSESLLDRCDALRQERPLLWVNVTGVHDVAMVQAIGERFGVHPLAIEDICNPTTRPKADDYEDHLFVALKMLSPAEVAPHEPFEVESEQVALVLGKGFVLTFQENPGDAFDPVRTRIRHGKPRLRQGGADYLAYALLDAVVDYYFVVLEHAGEATEALEEEILQGVGPGVLEEVYELKRELVFLRKVIWPARDAIGLLLREDQTLFSRKTRPFLRDLYDHVMQAAELVEAYRDVSLGMLDLHMTMASHRLNEVMKVLTLVGTTFIPMTWVAGVYGMNFAHMPELGWRWGYPAAMAIQFGIAAALLLLFRRRGWI